jgi:hypothetical protein
MSSKDTSKGKRYGPIGYIRPEIPGFEMPAYEGERYERLVPDTLDVAERAGYGVRFLTNMADPEADYEIYFQITLDRNPPVMRHDWHGANVQPKFLEALPLLRTMTGSDLSSDVDRGWAEALLHMQGEDGFIYTPVVGRPWARSGYVGLGWTLGDDGRGQFASIIANGMYAGVMALCHRQTGDEMWKDALERLVDRMAELMVYRDDYCYFPMLAVNPGAKVRSHQPMMDRGCRYEAGGSVAGWLIHGLSQAYLATGYEPALPLAGKLGVYLMRHSGCYDEEARFTGMAHTHHHLKPLIGLLEYGLIAGNEEMVEFARKGYEYTKTCGSTTIGYYASIPGPDFTYNYAALQRYFKVAAEGCTGADFIALGIKLSQAGVGDYWDDVDRCVRNHFFEGQMLRRDWIDQLVKTLPPTPVDDVCFETDERVAERNVGAFDTTPSPNDRGLRLYHCCSGNAMRSIYYLWDHILTFDGGTLRANLLLNRASPWADLDSYIPYEGRVDLTIKQPCDLLVRIPEWVRPEETACTVNGEGRGLGWEGRYAGVGSVKPKDVVTLSLPIAERTVHETIQGVDFTMVIRGNDVVAIDPPGERYPFYRDKGRYREGKARRVKRERFVSSEHLHWR